MKKDFKVFNFKNVLEDVRDQMNGDSDGLKMFVECKGITNLEDLPFFKAYLALFDVEKALDGFELEMPIDSPMSRADYELLLLFVVGSYSCEYSMDYLTDKNSVDIGVTVSSDGITMKRCFSDFDISYLVHKLFVIYMAEQFRAEGVLTYDDVENNAVRRARNEQLQLFEKKIELLKSQKEITLNKIGLDDLLNE